MKVVPRQCALSVQGKLFCCRNFSDTVHMQCIKNCRNCVSTSHFHVRRTPSVDLLLGFSIAVSSRYVYVCDTANERVEMFRHDGSFYCIVNATFRRPIQVGVIHDEEKIIVMEENCDVLRILRALDGTTEIEMDLDLREPPTMFALSAEELLVQDRISLHVFTLEGTFLRRMAMPGNLVACTVRDYLWVQHEGVEGEDAVVAVRPDGTIAYVCDAPTTHNPQNHKVSCVAVGAQESVLLTCFHTVVPASVSLAFRGSVRAPVRLFES